MNLSDEARQFADARRVARLATADAGGVPHVVPLCYALCADSLYFVVDEKRKRPGRRLKRLRNIAENPRVAVVIDDYDEDWSRLAYLLLQGTAAPVDDRAEYDGALAALRARYPQYRDMPLSFEKNPIIRIRIQQEHLWRAG